MFHWFTKHNISTKDKHAVYVYDMVYLRVYNLLLNILNKMLRDLQVIMNKVSPEKRLMAVKSNSKIQEYYMKKRRMA